MGPYRKKTLFAQMEPTENFEVRNSLNCWGCEGQYWGGRCVYWWGEGIDRNTARASEKKIEYSPP